VIPRITGRGRKYALYSITCAFALLGLLSNAVNTGTCNQYIVDDCEDAFATNPRAVFMLHPTVVQDRSLVKTDTPTVDLTSEWYLIRMEIVPTGPSQYLMRYIAKDILD